MLRQSLNMHNVLEIKSYKKSKQQIRENLVENQIFEMVSSLDC